ncbi:nuclease-related domain-containing protein [Bacillus piscicola]|uniref:nuclease-related domain-containing protein n=1 Tax=Bacillus piscicola TaxID=1632684 RepID=UPI001F089777|nr:nuclease-related domain-containing protein [Bacillus piscicola]
MIKKHRREPLELQVFLCASARKNFPPEDNFYFHHIYNDYKGMVRFDQFLNRAPLDNLILHNLTFEYRRSYIHVDTLLIKANTVHLFEMCTRPGSYYAKGDYWYPYPEMDERWAPHQELQDKASLFTSFLRQIGFSSFTAASHLMCMEPQFVLYNAQPDPDVVFAGQLGSFFADLVLDSPPDVTEQHHQLADRLLSLHIEDPSDRYTPAYEYEELAKGVTCEKCATMMTFDENQFHCAPCDRSWKYDTTMQRLIGEFKLLFPERRATAAALDDWCAGTVPLSTIRQSLKEYSPPRRPSKTTSFFMESL